MKTTISASNITFLKSLGKNNDREWFADNKDKYTAAHENTIAFADALLAEMRKHDHIETSTGKQALFRIYRDTRFSNDKTPYKTHWGLHFKRATQKLRGGYYLHIEPGGSFAAGGFFSPNPEDTARIRMDIDMNFDDWKKLLGAKVFAKTFGDMRGDKVATAPKGYTKDNPAIALLRHKQFYFEHAFSDKEVLAPDFVKNVNTVFKTLRPWFDYMSEVLTTDGNGNPL